MLLTFCQAPDVPFQDAIIVLIVSLSLTNADNCTYSLIFGEVLLFAMVNIGVVSATVIVCIPVVKIEKPLTTGIFPEITSPPA